MRRTPYAERSKKDNKSAYLTTKLKNPGDFAPNIVPRHNNESMPSQNLFSERQKNVYLINHKNHPPEAKRSYSINRVPSQLRNRDIQRKDLSKPKNLWVTGMEDKRLNRMSPMYNSSRGKIYRGNSWKEEEKCQTPGRQYRYTRGITPKSRQERISLKSCHIKQGMCDLLNKNVRRQTPDLKTRQNYFEYVMRFSYRTKKGSIPSNPNKVNQDAYIINPNIGQKTFQHLFGICDGHGPLGHKVSAFIKNILPNVIVNSKNLQINPFDSLMKSFQQSYNHLLKDSHVDMSFSGSTVIAAYFLKNRIYCCNVGDSRAIMGRVESGTQQWKSIALSEDHKPDLKKQAERIKKMGGRVQAYKDQFGNQLGPLRVWAKNQNVPGLAMTRSFGDLVGTSFGVSPIPQIKQFTITHEDKIFLIASDGVFQFLSNDEIISIVSPYYQSKQIQQASDKLMAMAHKSWGQNSSIIDDITFILNFLYYEE